MPVARLFNPQNDLALAAGLEAYTPPRSAARFAGAGALLPAWWAAEGDTVIAPGKSGQAEMLRRRYGLRFELDGAERCTAAEPWGWSANAAWILKKHGVSTGALPSARTLDNIRQLSHRRTAMTLRSALAAEPGFEVTDTESARAIIEAHGGRMFAKSPWSCSGRGVVPLHGMPVASALTVIAGIIRRQGSAMLERAWPAGRDMAALFMAGESGVTHCGWSLTECSPAGAYLGNIVAAQWRIEETIGSLTEMASLRATVKRLETALGELLRGSGYGGPLGVDMLIAPDGAVNPCIELNLRRTMGFAAIDIHRRLGAEGVLTMCAPEGCDTLMLCPPEQGFSIGLVKRRL